MLPNFLIIGAPRCGTTSLYFYLRQHPDVFMPAVKEPNYYWPEGWERTADAIRTRAEYERLFDRAAGERAVGEATTHILVSPSAPERVLRDLPGVRLVVSLRQPADRAYSHYLHRVRWGLESRPVEEALVPGNPAYDFGRYGELLQPWLDRVPRERLHVIVYEELAEDADRVMRDLFAFLGVDASFPVDTRTRHNPSSVPRSLALTRLVWSGIRLARRILPGALLNRGIGGRVLSTTWGNAPSFPPELRRRLLGEYRDDIQATARLIGRDLSRWFV